MEFPYCSPNYHLYNFNNQATRAGRYSTGEQQSQHFQRPSEAETSMVPTLSVKVINPSRKSDAKLFILRDVDFRCFDQPDSVRRLFISELADEVSDEPNFEFGYFQGNRRVWVKGVEGLREVQQALQQSKDIVLWCMGKSESRKRQCPVDEDSEAEADTGTEKKDKSKKKPDKRSRYEEKLDRIDDMVDKLKQNHMNTYTSIQYRVWAETLEAGRHDSFDNPPKGSFFKSQGRKTTSSKSNTPDKATASVSESAGLTPSKVADLRSTYIRQIKELHGLMEIGAIDNEHFIEQRDLLLKQMNTLSM